MSIAERVDRVIESEIASRLDELPHAKTCSAAQAYVSIDQNVEVDAAWGHEAIGEAPVELDTRFDIASVSKLFTATAAMIGVDEGRWSLDTPCHTLFPELADSNMTLLNLLNHTSGLPAWDKYYERFPIVWDPEVNLATRGALRQEILASPRHDAGDQYAYSDLGYMLLGWAIERVFDQPLDDIVKDRILTPLGMNYTRYVNVFKGDRPLTPCVATENCDARTRPVVGVVHDENTYIQGGVAGHAGLFSIAGDLGLFGEHMLAIDRGLNGVVSREVLQFCWSPAAQGNGGHHRGGWDTPSGAKTSVGRGFVHAQTVGHLGFTGTSLWLDRAQQTVAVLLTNRVYPTRENARIQAMRIAFHEAVSPP